MTSGQEAYVTAGGLRMRVAGYGGSRPLLLITGIVFLLDEPESVVGIIRDVLDAP